MKPAINGHKWLTRGPKTPTYKGPPPCHSIQKRAMGPIQGEDGRPPLSWGLFPYAALSMLTALQRKGLSKRAQLKVSVVEIYLEPWADPQKNWLPK